MFPPLTSRGRFLLHKTIEENFPSLKTFSVGREPFRQTVLTFSQLLAEHEQKKNEKQGTFSLRDFLNASKPIQTKLAVKSSLTKSASEIPFDNKRVIESVEASDSNPTSLHREPKAENSVTRSCQFSLKDFIQNHSAKEVEASSNCESISVKRKSPFRKNQVEE